MGICARSRWPLHAWYEEKSEGTAIRVKLLREYKTCTGTVKETHTHVYICKDYLPQN